MQNSGTGSAHEGLNQPAPDRNLYRHTQAPQGCRKRPPVGFLLRSLLHHLLRLSDGLRALLEGVHTVKQGRQGINQSLYGDLALGVPVTALMWSSNETEGKGQATGRDAQPLKVEDLP